MKTILCKSTGMFGATIKDLARRNANARLQGYHWLRYILCSAVVGLIAGCSYSSPITSTLMLNGDEAFIPKVSNYSTSLATSTNGLVLRPGDVLFLSQQTFPPKGREVGELYGRRAPSDLGVLRLPLRKVGLNSGANCDEVAVGVNALSPSEQLVISTFLGNVRQQYSYESTNPVDLVRKRGLNWEQARNKFLRVLEKCNGRLWNALVDGLRAHALSGSKERLVVSIDLEMMRMVLPDSWHESIPPNENPTRLTPQHVFGYLFIKDYTHEGVSGVARVELSTLNGSAYSMFGHVLDQSESQTTYGDAFKPRDEKEFVPRFTPHHTVLLNGVDFRSDNLDHDEMHWMLKEVEDSMICVDRDENSDLVARHIVSLSHDSRDLDLFDDRSETNVPQECEITIDVRLNEYGEDSKGRLYSGLRYFSYPLESTPKNTAEDFGNPNKCGPTWFWRAKTGLVALATRITENVPIHSVSELVWSGALESVRKKPSLSSRCLVK